MKGEFQKKHIASDSIVNILGVVYVHRKTSDGGDIYFTRFGLPFTEHLDPENWYEKKWFSENRIKLEGTSSVFKIPTKHLNELSIELVVKNSRVGEDVPADTRTLIEFINTEFNSPWEEFSLVMEMRDGTYGPREIRINTQKPLAIYVPPQRLQPWQSGRSQARINRIRAKHPGIDIDILRQYKLIYEWIRGKDIVQLIEEIGCEEEKKKELLSEITTKVIDDLRLKGYAVADMKANHIIIGEKRTNTILSLVAGNEKLTKELQLKTLKNFVSIGEYSVVDHELLIRTPEHEKEVRINRRHNYLDEQVNRFKITPLPAHLSRVNIMGVPYIFGHVESTGGALWVVGNNARLFDYFLPERWRKTPAWKLSIFKEVFYTVTKDQIHLVWKTSRVGELPSLDSSDPKVEMIAVIGFNSPFEEFSIAYSLSQQGIPTVYVRAIYMTGSKKQEESVDIRRFESHKDIINPDGTPVLRGDRNYITLRGFFNGSDEWVATHPPNELCRPIDLSKALQKGIISQKEQSFLLDRMLSRLKAVGYDGSLLEPNDFLVAIQPDGKIVKDKDNYPEVRICNFELIKRI